MTRCLLVDDDAEIRQLVVDYLRDFGIEVTALPDGAALRALHASAPTPPFQLLLLDLMLPGEGGLSLCRWMRAQWPLPIIMLTAQGDPISRVLGLEMGADDYIAKPFEPRELAARIKAVLRRSPVSYSAVSVSRPVRFGAWSFDRTRRELRSSNGVMTALSGAEQRLLSAFIDAPRQALSRQRLIELCHAPGVEVNERSIDLAVSRLRSKLGEAAPIRTVRGTGYLFDTEVLA